MNLEKCKNLCNQTKSPTWLMLKYLIDFPLTGWNLQIPDISKNNIELISLGLDTVATSDWLRSTSAKTCRQKNYKL